MNRIILTFIFSLAIFSVFGQIKLDVTNATCGNKGKIEASISGGIDGRIRYTINGGIWQGSGTFNNLEPGTYIITVKDFETNCSFSKTATVLSSPEISLSISGGGFFTYCYNAEDPPTVQLKASASGGSPPYTYNWSSPCTGCLTVNSGGLYKATVRDINQCKADANVFVAIVPIPCLVSVDPNDIIGPDGYADAKWVAKKDSLPYQVRFENDPNLATGPARKVTLEVPLETDIALNSFRVGSFGFANLSFNVPANRTFYQTRVNAIDSLGVLVDVNVGIDIAERKAFWIFQAIDPATGLPPFGSALGMLPVNDSLTHRGEGFVNFTVRPASSTVTGSTIEAQASIIFDENAPIETNTWQNTIDALPPTTFVNNLPAQTTDISFPVSWHGADDAGGSGNKDYSLYVSRDGGNYELYESAINDTVIIFTGDAGSSYSFFVRGRDNTGNLEGLKSMGSTPIYIIPANIDGLVLNPKILLLGVFDQSSGLMKDDLRQLSLVPLFHPYTAAQGYSHSGTETVNPNVFTVTGSNAIVDWVLVELRNKANTGLTLYSRAALLQRDGDIVDTDGLSPLTFSGALPDDYYVVIRHRNHLGISTKTPVALGFNPLSLNFTNGSVATFGTDAQANIGGKFLLWSGDANGDGKIIYAGSGTDVNAVSAKVFTNPLNTAFSPTFPFLGYDRADLNLDGKVIYAGAGKDVNFISMPVFSAPVNVVALSPTFVLMAALP